MVNAELEKFLKRLKKGSEMEEKLGDVLLNAWKGPSFITITIIIIIIICFILFHWIAVLCVGEEIDDFWGSISRNSSSALLIFSQTPIVT